MKEIVIKADKLDKEIRRLYRHQPDQFFDSERYSDSWGQRGR